MLESIENAERINAHDRPLKAIRAADDVAATMRSIGREARAAAHVLALAPAAQKNRALGAMAKSVRSTQAAILAANAEDIAEAKSRGATAAFIDRLALDAKRIEAMATRRWSEAQGSGRNRHGVLAAAKRHAHRARAVSASASSAWSRREPPNVTADAAGLCLKAGNAVILRGGSESFHSSGAILQALQEGFARLACRSNACRPSRPAIALRSVPC